MSQHIYCLFRGIFSIVAILFNPLTVQAGMVSREVNVALIAAKFDSYDLDLDLNGSTDFTFTAAYAPDPLLAAGFDTVNFRFGSNNAVVIDSIAGDGFPAVSRLGLGNTISAASTFSGPNDQGNLYFYISTDVPPLTGNFGGQTGFIGLRFDTSGGINYGYALISVNDLGNPNSPFDLTIRSVGYNDIVGQVAIAIPEPGSLFILGIGGCLVAAYRWRYKSKVARRTSKRTRFMLAIKQQQWQSHNRP